MRNEVEVSNRFGTPTVHMGLNTEPPTGHFENKEFAKELEKTIRELFKKYDEVRLSWSCDGLTRHQMHSRQWAIDVIEVPRVKIVSTDGTRS